MEEFNEILSDGERAIPALTRPDVFFVPLVFVVVRSSDVLIVEANCYLKFAIVRAAPTRLVATSLHSTQL